VWDFEAAIARDDYDEADRLYGGPFLDGFFLDGSGEFERWAETERRRLADRHAQVLESIAVRKSERGDCVGAVSVWRRLAAADPHSARVALGLMRALDDTGDRAGAIRHGAEHAALLDSELGAAPDPDVLAYANRLRTAEASPQRLAGADRFATLPDSVATATSPPTAAPSFERTTRHARLLYAIGAILGSAVLVAAIVSRGATVIPFGHGTPRPVPALITDFGSVTEDSALVRLTTDVVRLAWEQSGIVRIISPEAMTTALRRMRRAPSERVTLSLAREIGRRDGVPAIIDGDLTRNGAGFLLTMRIVTSDSGVTLAQESVPAGTPAELIAASDRATRSLRARIGESARLIRATPPLQMVTTASLAALEKFTEAQRVLRREGDHAKAIELFKQAVEIDTAFAMAWRMLYISYGNGRLGTPAQRREAIERAFRHRERLTDIERLHTEGTYYIPRDRVKTTVAYEQLVAKDSTKGLVNLAQTFFTRREFARSETLQRAALRHNNYAWVAHNNLIDILMNEGKVREADSAARAGSRQFPQALLFRFHLASIACARASDTRCALALDSLRASPNAEVRVRALELMALLARAHGSLATARQLDQQVRVLHEERGSDVTRTSSVFTDARTALTILGDTATARARLEVIGRPKVAADARTLAALYARAGRPQNARTVLVGFEKSVPDSARTAWDRSFLQEGWAEIALAEGRWVDALSGFKNSDDLVDGPRDTCSACLPHALARVYDRAEKPDSAIMMYERYVSTTYYPRFELDAYDLAPTYERLGALYERTGRRAEASRALSRFVELWEGADVELQPRVVRARQRFVTLTAK
jgi:DNA-binding SARP family transcriptional activator